MNSDCHSLVHSLINSTVAEAFYKSSCQRRWKILNSHCGRDSLPIECCGLLAPPIIHCEFLCSKRFVFTWAADGVCNSLTWGGGESFNSVWGRKLSRGICSNFPTWSRVSCSIAHCSAMRHEFSLLLKSNVALDASSYDALLFSIGSSSSSASSSDLQIQSLYRKRWPLIFLIKKSQQNLRLARL